MVEIDHSCGVENYIPQRRENYRITPYVCGKAPTRQLHSMPTFVFGSVHTGRKANESDAGIIFARKPSPKVFSLRIQLTLSATHHTPPGGSCLVTVVSAWSV